MGKYGKARIVDVPQRYRRNNHQRKTREAASTQEKLKDCSLPLNRSNFIKE